jgi:hypothetical protein
MKVTDKMLDVAQDTYDTFSVYSVCDRNAMRRAIEAAIQAVWVKFDINDESTHPQNLQQVIVLYHTGIVGSDEWSILKTWMYAGCKNCVTHWMALPEFITH